jgi:hypothetical protein
MKSQGINEIPMHITTFSVMANSVERVSILQHDVLMAGNSKWRPGKSGNLWKLSLFM